MPINCRDCSERSSNADRRLNRGMCDNSTLTEPRNGIVRCVVVSVIASAVLVLVTQSASARPAKDSSKRGTKLERKSVSSKKEAGVSKKKLAKNESKAESKAKSVFSGKKEELLDKLKAKGLSDDEVKRFFQAVEKMKAQGLSDDDIRKHFQSIEHRARALERRNGDESRQTESGDAGNSGNASPASTQLTQPAALVNPGHLPIDLEPARTVHFNFKGQPWTEVLQALADLSGLSLDWQELPGVPLNLVTQRDYTINEARDVINRHLLLRRYTLLQLGDALTVVSTAKLDPGMVPRVTPDELDGVSDHEYVKVIFPLTWITAEQAAAELKSLLSPNGRLTALPTSNRIEAMDAAIYLREVNRLLTDEQASHRSGHAAGPVREFPLTHARASTVVEKLKSFLGLTSPSSSRPSTSPSRSSSRSAQMQQMQQMQAAMAKLRQAKGSATAKQPEVHLLANERHNSVIAYAPPDKMGIIERTIALLDRRRDDSADSFAGRNATQVYRLAGIDPEQLVKVLEQTGGLTPATHLEVDAKNHAIITTASIRDHAIIRRIIDRLDGGNRQFHVISLRTLEADYLVGTIKTMMGQSKATQKPNPYSFFSYRPSQPQQTSRDAFAIEADVESNRILVRANDVEIDEIKNLLVKLGEIPAGGNQDTIRVIDSVPPDDIHDVIDHIRKTWPAYHANPLQIDSTGQQPLKEKNTIGQTNLQVDPTARPHHARLSLDRVQ